MDIPYTSVSPEALEGIIEEFVTREGTEYGTVSYDLATRIAQVRRQLELGKAKIVFDPETETCNLVVPGQ